MPDPLIESLRRLCVARGGAKAVARVLDVNDQTIYQILSGVKLPSGRPRGVGPTLREKLDRHYPGWADATKSGTRAADPLDAADVKTLRVRMAVQKPAAQALAALADLLAAVPVGPRRVAVAGLLSAWAQDGGSPDYVDALLALLQPSGAQETGRDQAHG